MKGSVLISLTLALGTLLAGCVTSESTPPASASGAPDAAPPGDFDETTGALSGVVTDSELNPITSAQVALKDTDVQTTTAQDGSFSLSRITPGDYVLLVGALGYQAATRMVTVAAGQETAGVNVQLEAIPVIEGRSELYMFEGYITCTIGAFGVLSEECGQGLQTPVGTYGTNPNNKIDWKFNYTQEQVDAGLVGTIVEMDWEPGSAAATQLTLYIANKFTCIPSCNADGPEYCDGTDNHGPPPQRCYIDDLQMKEDEMPWDMTARAWGAPVEATEVPNVVLEQRFTMYRTDFYGEMGAEDFTAIPDA